MIKRKLDGAGRIVIPKEMRKMLEIDGDDSLEMRCEGNMITITKSIEICHLCGEKIEPDDFSELKVCDTCAERIARRQMAKKITTPRPIKQTGTIT